MKKGLMAVICSLTIAMNSYAYADSYIMKTVGKGETYWTIAQSHSIEIDDLKRINENLGEVLHEGSLIKIKPISQGNTISLKVNGEQVNTDEPPYMENNRVFVPIRFIAETLGLQVTWNEKTQSAQLNSKDLSIALPLGSYTVTVNGNAIKLDAPVNVYKGRTFVPVRFIAEALDCTVDWDSENHTVSIITENNHNDIYWLSRIVEAESKGESFDGKLAVANVIINRKKSQEFPNTIKEVIFDKQDGYIQFSPVINGTVYNSPSIDSIKAAKMALEGKNNIGDSLYFLNPDKSTNLWTIYNKTLYKSIGNHDFYF